MISHNMFTAEDFQRGDQYIDACAQVKLASMLRLTPPEFGDLEACFDASVQELGLTSENISQFELDPDYARSLAMYGLANRMRYQEFEQSLGQGERAGKNLHHVNNSFKGHVVGVFPMPDCPILNVKYVSDTMGGQQVEQKEQFSIEGVFYHTQSKAPAVLQINGRGRSLQAILNRQEIDVFIPGTLVEHAIRLAITDTPYVPYEDEDKTRRNSKRGLFRRTIG